MDIIPSFLIFTSTSLSIDWGTVSLTTFLEIEDEYPQSVIHKQEKAAFIAFIINAWRKLCNAYH